MSDLPSHAPPVAIGGLGGSGTRVFAALLQAAGASLGPCLNAPLDNLWFTVLFKRPEWARPPTARAPTPDEVGTSMRLFQRAMVCGLSNRTDTPDRELLRRLRSALPPQGDWQCGARAEHADSLMSSLPPTDASLRFWGWKEPNTHVFLPQLDRHIPCLRYIHVVRNGQDMAFSANTWQARHWGHLYDLRYRPDLPLPPQQLRYWTAANQKAILYGKTHMQGRFLTVHYEDFCARPQAHWIRIQRFLGLSGNLPVPHGLVEPSSIGRSQERDLAVFSQTDRQDANAVQNLLEREGRVS